MRMKFWLRTAVQTLALNLGLGVVCSGWIAICAGEQTESLMGILCLNLGIMGGIMEVVYLWKAFDGPVSLCLSFGSTRREAFFGLTVFALSLIFSSTVVVGLLSLLIQGERVFNRSLVLPLTLTIQLFSSALGLVCGLLQRRFGKPGAFSAYIVGLLLIIALYITTMLGILPGGAALWWMLAGAAGGCFCLTLIPTARAVNQLSVAL